MKDYKIRFEFYGKYMSTTIRARSVDDAKRQINARLNFISIDDITAKSEDSTLDYLKDIFKMK